MDPSANIIFGALVDETLGDKVKITVLATGFDSADKLAPQSTVEETTKKDSPLPAKKKDPPPEKKDRPGGKEKGFLEGFRRQ